VREFRGCSKKEQLWCSCPVENRGFADKEDIIQRTDAQRAATMATTTAPPHQIVPLHLSGNTTETQNKLLQEFLVEAAKQAYQTAIEQLDRQSAQAVLDMDKKLKREVADLVVEIIHRHTISDKFKDEQVGSNRVYPPTYRVRPVEAQVTELRKVFPKLGSCQEKLARRQLPENAEAWFAIPRWQAIAPTYNEAVEMLMNVLCSRRRFSNRIVGKLGEQYMRQTERSKLAEKILADQQEGSDILVVAAQAGMLHRGSSARRTRVAMAGNEFGLGVFAFACILLTHPERLSTGDTLMIDCGGDEYSVRGDYTFDRVPLFDYDMSGIEFSIFYEDRARNLWGTPTGFLYKLV
jgi:predicted outer membrane protein